MTDKLVTPDKPPLWIRYWQSINFKSDLRYLFLRPHKRHATLDGTRAIVILLLVLFHVLYGVIRILVDDKDRLDTFFYNFPSYLNWMWQTQGSDPLFVVSGMLVSLTIFREVDRTQTLDIKRFYKRRLMRIYPLFIVALLIYIPSNSHNWDYLLSNLLFVSNYLPGNRPIIPVGWSLEVQMQFYLLLPFLCLLALKMRWHITVLAALSIAAVVYRYLVVASHPEYYETPVYQVFYDREFGKMLADNLYYDLDVRLAGFLMGVLVAYLHHHHGKAITEYFKRHRLINSLLLILSLSMIFWSFNFPMLNKAADFYQNFDSHQNMWYLAINRNTYSLGMSIMIILVLCPAGLSRIVEWVFSWPVWHPFGQLIYPIYLFHFPFIAVAAVVVFGTTDRTSIVSVSMPQLFSIYFLAVVFTVMFSALMHILVEKPFLKLREL